MRVLSFCVAIFLVLSAMLPARTQGPALPAPVDGGSRQTLESIFIPPTPNAPFTLTLATTWVRPLGADGNTMTFANERKIARDGTGRIFEQRVNLTPPDEHLHLGPNWLQMADALQHTLDNCSVATHICHLLPYNPRPTAAPALDSGTEQSSIGKLVRTSLGTDVMEGMEVHGVRETTIINAGIMGNSKPVTIEREYWYSPELGINLKSSVTDPRFGTQTFFVKKLSRDEPDPALWNIPNGYSVVDDRPLPH